MKTNILMTLCLLFIGSATVFGQHPNIPVYPIPSYNITVDGLADFANLCTTIGHNTDGKRQVHVHVDPILNGIPGCDATVWVYTLDATTVLGPFTVDCEQTLDVNIDDRDWGVMVNSEEKIIVTVWFTLE